MTASSAVATTWRTDSVQSRAPSPELGTGAVESVRRVRIGRLSVDAVTFDGALEAIGGLVESGKGGAVFTPNVDHVITAEMNRDFRRAYRTADLVLADGAPIVWASHLLGSALPEKVSGSDLVRPLARLAGQRGWRVYLLGGAPGVAELAAEKLRSEFGVNVVGIDDAIIRVNAAEHEQRAITDRIEAAGTQLLFVALGAPKQELWISRVRQNLGPVVAIGVGASLDFVAGKVRRAPRWMSALGLEWTFRLAQEPRRLWRRYLHRGPKFISIVFQSRRSRRTQRKSLSRSARGLEATRGQ